MGDLPIRRVLASLSVASLVVLGCSPAPTGPSPAAVALRVKASLSCGTTTNNDNNPPTTAGGGCNNQNNNNNNSTTNNSNNPPATAGN
jgi:hypothetical protein